MNDNRNPRIEDVADAAAQRRAALVRVACDALVEAYDPATQRATVTALVPIAFNDGEGGVMWKSLPTLQGVPVRWPTSANMAITDALQPGDTVLLVLRDRSHAEVNAGIRDVVAPSSSRRWDWFDAVAIPQNTYALPEGAVGAGPVFYLAPGAILQLGSATAAKALALAERVDSELSAVHTALSSHTHAAGTLVVGTTPVTGATAVGGTYAAPTTVASTRLFTDG